MFEFDCMDSCSYGFDPATSMEEFDPQSNAAFDLDSGSDCFVDPAIDDPATSMEEFDPQSNAALLDLDGDGTSESTLYKVTVRSDVDGDGISETEISITDTDGDGTFKSALDTVTVQSDQDGDGTFETTASADTNGDGTFKSGDQSLAAS